MVYRGVEVQDVYDLTEILKSCVDKEQVSCTFSIQHVFVVLTPLKRADDSSVCQSFQRDTCFTHAIRVRPCRESHTGGPEEAHGGQGILQAFTAALNNVQVAGPTLFTEVLPTAMARANSPASQTDHRHEVLLILTDGIISDMQQVCLRLVSGWNAECSRYRGFGWCVGI